jgi:hypothetical protein
MERERIRVMERERIRVRIRLNVTLKRGEHKPTTDNVGNHHSC